jgi:hypothetical protein
LTVAPFVALDRVQASFNTLNNSIIDVRIIASITYDHQLSCRTRKICREFLLVSCQYRALGDESSFVAAKDH